MHKIYFLKKTYSIFVKKYILWLYLPISISHIRVYAQKCKKPRKKIVRDSDPWRYPCDSLSRTLKWSEWYSPFTAYLCTERIMNDHPTQKLFVLYSYRWHTVYPRADYPRTLLADREKNRSWIFPRCSDSRRREGTRIPYARYVSTRTPHTLYACFCLQNTSLIMTFDSLSNIENREKDTPEECISYTPKWKCERGDRWWKIYDTLSRGSASRYSDDPFSYRWYHRLTRTPIPKTARSWTFERETRDAYDFSLYPSDESSAWTDKEKWIWIALPYDTRHHQAGRWMMFRTLRRPIARKVL